MHYYASVRELLDSKYCPKAIFLDIDGTLRIKDKAADGAINFIDLLEQRKIPYLLITNDCTLTPLQKSEQLSKIGFNIDKSQIISCGMSLKLYVVKHSLEGKRFCTIGDFGDGYYAKESGIIETNDLISSPEEPLLGVILSEKNYQWEKSINQIFNFFISNPNSHFIIPNPDTYWVDDNYDLTLAPGSIARWILSELRLKKISPQIALLGKPNVAIFEFALKKMSEIFPKTKNYRKKDFMIIGDNIESDIIGGKKFKIMTNLILSGVSKIIDHSGDKIRPDYVSKQLMN